MANQHRHGLLAEAEQIARQFDLSPDHVRRTTTHFVHQMKDGLANNRVWQLPAYVRSVPTGTETGEFLAVDLGGSNCRVCLVKLHGDSTFNVVQGKHAVPPEVMVNISYKPLFAFVAQKISDFLDAHTSHTEELPLKLGFTFSFTCEQTSLAGGRLIHWDKGWDIPDAIGRDPCAMLQEAIDELELPVLVTVLANDSVGTLLTRSYSAGPRTSTLGAVIFGTGTNAAYVEKLSNIGRLGATADLDGIMVINTEWGCLDDKMEVLPHTAYDDELDNASTEPGSQMLEKRVSGLYLGKLLRLAFLDIYQKGLFEMEIYEKSPILRRDSIDSSFLSDLATVDGNLEDTIKLIQSTLVSESVTKTDAQAIQLLATSIAGRLEHSHHNQPPTAKDVITISTPTTTPRGFTRFWHNINLLWRRLLNMVGINPIFKDMRSALRDVPEIGVSGENRVRIGLAKDGSGVGAALMAQAVSQAGIP
ncbi:hexokinase [Aspergillus crustosus]